MSSKLHIPGSRNVTACGRQLNNHRADRVQDSANAEIAGSLEQYLAALSLVRACRFCGRAASILPKLTRPVRAIAEDEGEESNWGDE